MCVNDSEFMPETQVIQRVVVDSEKHPAIGLVVLLFIGLPTALFVWYIIFQVVKEAGKKGIEKLTSRDE